MNLTKADFDNLAAAGISRYVIETAQLRRVDSAEGAQIVGRNGTGDYGGLEFPYFWPGEDTPREYRLRRDHPEIEEGAEGPKERNKYISPPGRGNLLYLFPQTPLEWLQDSSIELVITEGEKKVLALWDLAWFSLGDAAERPRFLPIGIPGVWCWRGTVGKTSYRTNHHGQPIETTAFSPNDRGSRSSVAFHFLKS